MTCQKCDYEVKTEDKFCTNCGESLEGNEGVDRSLEALEKEETAATTAESDDVVEASVEESTSSKQANEYVEKTKETAANYWNFFLQSLKSPLARSVENRPSDFIFGYINIAVYALLFALSSYLVNRSNAYISSNVSFVDYFIQPFFYLIISSLVVAALLFAVLKFVMKAETISFHDVVARYGTLYTVIIVVTAAYFILNFTGMLQLILILDILITIGLYMAAIVALLTLRDETKVSFDPIFAVIIVFAGYAIFETLTIDLYADMFLRNNPFL
jgi:hypothetical protein